MAYENELYGLPFSGVRNADVSGSTGVEYPRGFGEVYGIYWNTDANKSYGISEHSLSTFLKPSESGIIAWPARIPFGKEIVLGFSGITYYDEYSNFTILDDKAELSLASGIIAELEIKPVETGSEVIQTGVVLNDRLPFIQGEYLTGRNHGIFLTKERFCRVKNFNTTHSQPQNQSISGLLKSMDIQTPAMTGYIAYASGEGMQMFDGGANFADHIKGGTLNNDISKSDFYLSPFSVNVAQDYFIMDTGDIFHATGWRVTGFFADEKERKSNIDRLLTVSANKQPNYTVFFTGRDEATNDPLYLTYISGESGSLFTCITTGQLYFDSGINSGDNIFSEVTMTAGSEQIHCDFFGTPPNDLGYIKTSPSVAGFSLGEYSATLRGRLCSDENVWVDIPEGDVTYTCSAAQTFNESVTSCHYMSDYLFNPVNRCPGGGGRISIPFVIEQQGKYFNIKLSDGYAAGHGNIVFRISISARYDGNDYPLIDITRDVSIYVEGENIGYVPAPCS